jgi:REP element-mobilizing transposase RayT
MSRKYKMANPEGMYFVSFAVVYWMDVFVREEYMGIISDSLNYCSKEKGLELFGYCLMPSHMHMVFRDKNNEPSKLLKEFKTHTSKAIRKAIEENAQESRKEWILWMMKRAAEKKSNVSNYQFWQHHNKPIELWTNAVIDQKMDYMHSNPVVSGFVSKPEDWKYSSAGDYTGIKGQVVLCLI